MNFLPECLSPSHMIRHQIGVALRPSLEMLSDMEPIVVKHSSLAPAGESCAIPVNLM